MKPSNYFSRSHKGYTQLGKSSWFSMARLSKQCSSIQKFSPILHKALLILGHYFCLTTHYAPFALLPITLLYLTNKIPIIPSFVYVAIIIIFFLGVLYQMQDRLLYHPDMPEISRIFVGAPPSDIPHEEVQIRTGDGVQLHGFFLKQTEEELKDAPTLVCFHGNAGNASSPSVVLLYMACKAHVLMIDYRGYGKSTGFPSEEGLYRDGEAAVHYLHSRTDINLNKIVLFGHSLGGAVAIHIASRSQWVKGRIAAVILENTFTNIPATASEMFQSVLPFLQYLPHVCFKNRFESITKVNDIQVPILFICGDADNIVPPKMSHALYEAAGNPRSAVVEIPNGTHNDTWCVSTLYQSSIFQFLQKVFHEPTDGSHSWRAPEKSEERVALSHQWLRDVGSSSSM